MFYASRLVRRKLILSTNTFCVDIEKTSVKVALSQRYYRISERIFYPGYKPPQNPLGSCIIPGFISGILWCSSMYNSLALTRSISLILQFYSSLAGDTKAKRKRKLPKVSPPQLSFKSWTLRLEPKELQRARLTLWINSLFTRPRPKAGGRVLKCSWFVVFF